MVSVNYTIIAQIVNFIILLWILAKFAYKPLLKAMDCLLYTSPAGASARGDSHGCCNLP